MFVTGSKKADMIFLKNWWKTDGMDSRNITLVLLKFNMIQSKHKRHLTRWSVLQHIQNNWRKILQQTHLSITPYSHVRWGNIYQVHLKRHPSFCANSWAVSSFILWSAADFFFFLQHIVYCHLHLNNYPIRTTGTVSQPGLIILCRAQLRI